MEQEYYENWDQRQTDQSSIQSHKGHGYELGKVTKSLGHT